VLYSDEPKTVTSETWLKLRDRNFIKKSETRDLQIFQFCINYSKIIQENVFTTSNLNFFELLTFLQPVLVFPYLHVQQTEHSLNYKSFTKPA